MEYRWRQRNSRLHAPRQQCLFTNCLPRRWPAYAPATRLWWRWLWHGGEVSVTHLGRELLRESLDDGATKLVTFGVSPLPPSPPAAPLSCPCIDEFPLGTLASTGANSTYLPVLVHGEPYNYSARYGLSECAAHDRGMPPGCDDALSAPSWCDTRWCAAARPCRLPYVPQKYAPRVVAGATWT